MKPPKKFRIKVRELPNDEELIEKLSRMRLPASEAEGVSGELQYVVAPQLVKALVDIATHVWKARGRMVDSVSGEVRDEMKRIYGDMERIYKCFDELGIVIKDHTGETFDYGLPLKVIATKPMAIKEEIVTETLKPTIYWQDNIIQHGEVEVGTPNKPEDS
jgi:hypothetical protein